MSGVYRFLVRGHLDDRWSERFGDLAIQLLDDGSSVLTGTIQDQAALYGVIARIRDMGMPLLAIERIGDGEGNNERGRPAARGHVLRLLHTCAVDWRSSWVSQFERHLYSPVIAR